MKFYTLFLLSTGVSLNIIAQKIIELRVSDPQAHLMPWVKFASTTIFSGLWKLHRGVPSIHPTRRQQHLMLIIGILDASAYVCFTVGFTLCGAVLSSMLLAAGSQVFTALATRYILRKKLSTGQLVAVVLVCLGVVVRSIPSPALPTALRGASSLNKTHSASQTSSLDYSSDLRGSAFVVVAALLYSGLGVAYEKLVSDTAPQPSYSDTLWTISLVGTVASTAYQILYVVPRWDTLVGQHRASRDIPVLRMWTWFVAFGGLFNLHLFAQSLVFKSDGALAVSLVNALRGAVITVIAGMVFCSQENSALCLTFQSGAAAGLTAVGAAAWALAGAKKTGQCPPQKVDIGNEKKDT